MYGPGGSSRGIANVVFHHSDGASKAYQKLNGLLIDNRPIRVSQRSGAMFHTIQLMQYPGRGRRHR